MSDMMNVIHVSACDIGGGASRAAHRIHSSLLKSSDAHGVESRMRVIRRYSDDTTVLGGLPLQNPARRRLQPRLNHLATRGFHTISPTIHSILAPAPGLGRELEQRHKAGEADLVHLHWLDDETISINEIGSLSMPLLWTLHDMWAFCGAEHWPDSPTPAGMSSTVFRFLDGYDISGRPSHESGPDVNRWTWERKRRAWQRPIQIACPSVWLADCARRSALMRNWPVTVIPNPIDLDTWAPLDRDQARAVLQLPLHTPLVVFGAVGGTADPRKGADLLIECLQILHTQLAGTSLAKLQLVVFGQSRPPHPFDLGFPIHFTGRLHDDISLRLLYSAADVFVIPSRQDNLPNTGLEAHACGTPVVAFRTGGLVDIVEHQVTGALAEPFDPGSLAAAIHWVLEDPHRQQQLGEAARQRALRLWNQDRIAEMYVDLYRHVLENFRLTSQQSNSS